MVRVNVIYLNIRFDKCTSAEKHKVHEPRQWHIDLLLSSSCWAAPFSFVRGHRPTMKILPRAEGAWPGGAGAASEQPHFGAGAAAGPRVACTAAWWTGRRLPTTAASDRDHQQPTDYGGSRR